MVDKREEAEQEAPEEEEEEEEPSACEQYPNLPRCRWVKTLEDTGRMLAILFMIAMIAAAAALGLGREALANKLAEYAYYLLVASVASLLISIALEPRLEEAHGHVETLVEEGPMGETGHEEEAPGKKQPSLSDRLAPLFSRAFSHVSRVEDTGALYVTLLALALVGAMINTGSSLGLSLVPGRPTIITNPFEWSPLFRATALLLALLGLPLVLTKWGRLAALAYFLTTLSSPWVAYASLAPLIMLAAYIITGMGDERVRRGLSLSLLLLALITLSRPIHTWVASWAWSGLVMGSFLGMVVMLSTLLGLLATARPTVNEGDGAGTPPSLRPNGKRGRALLLLVPALLLAVGSVILVQSRVDGIVSLDTYYHTIACEKYEKGEITLFTPERPLFTLTTCALAPRLGGYYFFFDVTIPLLGLPALAVATYYILTRNGMNPHWAGAGAALSVSYWAPFFLYAGFQTNLLALPIALWMMDRLSRDMARGESSLLTGFLALFLGLFHPWTLAYFTVSTGVYIALSTRLEQTSPSTATRVAITTLLPGWVSYAAVTQLKGTASLATITGQLVQPLSGPFAIGDTLRIFAWGTGLRGEVVLPLALLIAFLYVKRGGLSRTDWMTAASLTSALGLLFLTRGDITLRLLVDMPAPLALMLLLRREVSSSIRPLLIITASSIIVLLYFLAFAPLTPAELELL